MTQIQIYRHGNGYDDDPRVEYNQRYVKYEDHEIVVEKLEMRIRELEAQRTDWK